MANGEQHGHAMARRELGEGRPEGNDTSTRRSQRTKEVAKRVRREGTQEKIRDLTTVQPSKDLHKRLKGLSEFGAIEAMRRPRRFGLWPSEAKSELLGFSRWERGEGR